MKTEVNRVAAHVENGRQLKHLRPQSAVRIGIHGAVLFEVWVITPELALDLLDRVHNRPLKASRIKRYAKVMSRGAWTLNYEWIGIDEYGYVIEGQHRLYACVESESNIVVLVLSGLPRALFPSLGVSLPRGVADNVALAGVTSATTVGAALAFIYRAEKGMSLAATGEGSRPENDEALEILSRHPGLEDSVRAANAARRIFPSMGMLAYLHYEFAKRDAALADHFVNKLGEGTELRTSDPIHVLRERLIDNKNGKLKMRAKDVLAITIKAWNYARAGRQAPKFLRWSEGANEAFPEIK